MGQIPSGVSDFGSQTWLSGLFGVVSIPSQYWIALCTDEPGALMDGDILADLEPADTAYQRQPYSAGANNWSSNGPYLTNIKDVIFPAPSVDWGYINHFALCTAASSGQLYSWGQMLNPQFISTGMGVLLPAGSLVLGLHALDNSIAV